MLDMKVYFKPYKSQREISKRKAFSQPPQIS